MHSHLVSIPHLVQNVTEDSIKISKVVNSLILRKSIIQTPAYSEIIECSLKKALRNKTH